MKFKILPMLLALSVIPFTNAYADDEIETGQVVISASRMEQAIEDVSMNIDVITSEELQKMGITNLSTILNMQAGVSTSNGGLASIRGLGTRYTLFLVDGRKQLLSENGGDAMSDFMSTFNINNIERIEIIKGAAATMYGSDAMGGVVNIITKKGLEPNGSIQASFSNMKALTNYTYDFGKIGNWTGKINASASQNLGAKIENGSVVDGEWVQSTSSTSTGSDSFEYNYKTNGVDLNWSFGGSLGYYFNENFDILGTWEYQKAKPLERYYLDDVATDTIGFKPNEYHVHNAGIDFRGAVGDHMFTISPFLAHSNYIHTAGPVYGEALEKDYSFYDFGFNSIDIFPVNDWNMISAVLDYRYSGLTHSVLEDYMQYDSGTADVLHQVGAFVQDEMLLLNEKLIVQPSVRFDYTSMSDPQFTARLGTTYEFMPNQRIKFNVGQAYRTPLLNELSGVNTQGTTFRFATIDGTLTLLDNDGNSLGITEDWFGNDLALNQNGFEGETAGTSDGDTSGIQFKGAMVLGNPDLQPEKAINADLRYEGKFGPLSTSLGGYMIRKDGEISTSDIIGVVQQTTGDYSYRVVQQKINEEGITYYTGLEAEAGLDFAKYFNTSLAYAYMRNTKEDSDGEQVLQNSYAPHNLTASLGFNYPDLAIFANVWGNATFATRNGVGDAHNEEKEYNQFNIHAAIGKTFADKYTFVLSADDLLQSSRVRSYADGTYASNSSWNTSEYKLTFTTTF